ncbi:MAG: Ribosomal RNA small subunit methyltransferase E [Chlamydiae bacterium]|nr:Ribosomal RNA small subunit methyltransferase E [Chlamydiota bacterium]
MPDNRFFTPEPLEKGTLISLDGDEMRHMAKVMRRGEDDRVELVNGQGALAIATIKSVSRNSAELLIEELSLEKRPEREMILAQALPQLPRLDLIIEKGTELGATAFWLFPGERSEKKELSPNQKRRLELLAISALKQSGRLFLPSIEFKPPLTEWDKPSTPLFYGAPEGPRLERPVGGALFLVGPGGGLSDKEKSYLSETLKATGKSLNPNILRAETAALCALSLLA